MSQERKEELASLYVAGAMTSAEAQAFERELLQDAELRALVTSLQAAMTGLAAGAPLKHPPAGLKAEIMAKIAEREKVVPVSFTAVDEHPRSRWLLWALAACFAVLVVYQQNMGFQTQTADMEAQLAEARSEQQRFQSLTGVPSAKLADQDKLLRSMSATNRLLAMELTQIKESNRLANLRIALLNSLLADSPKAVAVSVWDNQKQTGVFHVENLKPLPAGKDYQLWVIDPQYKTPVDAGVFQVDEKGNVRFEFKPRQPIAAANTFAVTEEPKGGRLTPTLDRMVLAGNAKEL